jgi:hypothetical protein
MVAALAIAMSFVSLGSGRHHKGPDLCGETMHWSKGHCVDARDKPS